MGEVKIVTLEALLDEKEKLIEAANLLNGAIAIEAMTVLSVQDLARLFLNFAYALKANCPVFYDFIIGAGDDVKQEQDLDDMDNEASVSENYSDRIVFEDEAVDFLATPTEDEGDASPESVSLWSGRTKRVTPRYGDAVQEKPKNPSKSNKMYVNKCGVCDKIFPKYLCLVRHYVQHHDTGDRRTAVFKPKPVSETGQTELVYKTVDLSILSGDKLSPHFQITCVHCRARYPRFEEFKEHSMSAHFKPTDKKSSEKVKHSKMNLGVWIECPACLANFKDVKELALHFKNNHGDDETGLVDPLICEHCSVKFPNLGRLKTHKLIHVPKYPCDQCNEWFANPRDRKIHVHQVHEDKEVFPCQHCSMTFLTPNRLSCHIKWCHREHWVNQRSGIKRSHQCESCGKIFHHPNRLKHHVRKVHEELKNVFCDSCGKGFYNNFILKKHILSVHERFKPHECDQCRMSFSQGSQLNRHKRDVHEKIMNFECATCGKRFAQKGNLKTHLLKHHSDIVN